MTKSVILTILTLLAAVVGVGAMAAANDALPLADKLIFSANFLLAVSAAALNSYAAIHAGPWRQWAPLRAVVAMLATSYAVGYLLVITGTIGIMEWSAFFRGVSMFAWLAVWDGPVILTEVVWRRAKAKAAIHVESAASLGSRLVGGTEDAPYPRR